MSASSSNLPSSSTTSVPVTHKLHTMSQNQRETWEQVQRMLQRRGGGGFPSGGGRGASGMAGLVLLGVGVWAASNSLFNGMQPPSFLHHCRLFLTHCSGWWSPRYQVLPTEWCQEGYLQRRYKWMHPRGQARSNVFSVQELIFAFHGSRHLSFTTSALSRATFRP